MQEAQDGKGSHRSIESIERDICLFPDRSWVTHAFPIQMEVRLVPDVL
jgi:hypothetical protein